MNPVLQALRMLQPGPASAATEPDAPESVGDADYRNPLQEELPELADGVPHMTGDEFDKYMDYIHKQRFS